MTDTLVVMVTVPDMACAARVARAVVEEGLASGGNIVPGLRSIYRWKGQICDEPELMILFQTVAERFEALRARVVALHPYECPEVLALPVSAGHLPYLAWVRTNTEPT